MAAREVSTKEKLLALIDDVETIAKELLETTIAPKQEKLSHSEQTQLIQLMMTKNEDLKDSLQLAKSQAEIDQKMIELQAEVSRHDQDIQMLQKHLKEAETLLSTALYQAKQKLDQITKAQMNSVGSEDLIRFAHRISSTNAVAAPANWQPGDQRKPYPTDFEMRMGLLARLSDSPINQLIDSLPRENMLNSNVNNLGNPFPPWHPHSHHSSSGQTPDHSSSALGMFHPPPHSSSPAMGIDPSTRNHEDVEVMSTDSSSSSSSDSQ